MRKISDVVEQVLSESEVELEALRKGVLNFSAYAQQIRPKVEDITMKEVKVGSIVVALSRIAATKNDMRALRPFVGLEDITVKSPLCDLSFEKTKDNMEKLSSLRSLLSLKPSDFMTMTAGVTEITVIVSQENEANVLSVLSGEPKVVIRNLVGVTVRFDKEYIEVPNSLYTLMYQLASKHINILEIVSTFTELTFIIHQEDVSQALDVLGKMLGKKKTIS